MSAGWSVWWNYSVSTKSKSAYGKPYMESAFTVLPNLKAYPLHSTLMWDRNLLNCPNAFTRFTLFVRRARYDAYDYVTIIVYSCFVDSTATIYNCLSTPTTVLIQPNMCVLRWQMSLSMTQAQTPTRLYLTYDIKRIKEVRPFNKANYDFLISRGYGRIARQTTQWKTGQKSNCPATFNETIKYPINTCSTVHALTVVDRPT